MSNAQVVNLGQVKDLLAELEVIRQHILQGKVSGWMGTLRDAEGRETIYIGGVFKTDQAKMVRAAMRMSTVLSELEEDPLRAAAHH